MTEIEHDRRFSPFYRQLLAVSGVVLYMIGTGANIAYPGVLLQQLREPDSEIHLTVDHESWIASLLGLALMTGISASPWILQRWGRKTANQVSSVPTLAGWGLMAFASTPDQLLASRVLQGFGMGLQASAAPVSIAEYSSPENRGAFLATIAFSFATGMLIAHIFGTILYWRPGALACGSVYILSFILVTLSPESPGWLASRGLYDRCRKSYRWLRGSDEKSENELEIMIASQRSRRNEAPSKISKFRYALELVRKPEFYKPTFIMMLLFTLFQVSGMTVVPSYTMFMMNEVTKGSIDSNMSMFMVDSVRFFTAILACIVVNKYPRRTVLFTGSIICVFGLFAAALAMYLRDLEYIPREYEWVPVIPTLVYIFGKTIGILPIPWAVAGEIFPLSYKSMGSGVSGATLSLMFFIIVKTAQFKFDLIGINGTFCVYGVLISICVGCLYFLLPETKGKTLYEIECHFRGIKEPIKIDHHEKDKMLELDHLEGG